MFKTVPHSVLGQLRLCRLCACIWPLIMIAQKLPPALADAWANMLRSIRDVWNRLLVATNDRLPENWAQCWSDVYQIPYWWNYVTGESIWERPSGP